MLITEAARVAEQDEAPIAGPVLMAFGIHTQHARDALLKQLRASRRFDREALVRTAAIVAATDAGLSLDTRERVLSRLARGETLDALSPEDRDLVEGWSAALDLSGLGHFMGWMVEIGFKLPLTGEVGDIRAYVLPERIGVLTMRSLTPHREEDGGRPDDGS